MLTINPLLRHHCSNIDLLVYCQNSQTSYIPTYVPVYSSSVIKSSQFMTRDFVKFPISYLFSTLYILYNSFHSLCNMIILLFFFQSIYDVHNSEGRL